MTEFDTAAILHLLQTGTLEVEGLLPWSSNYTFLIRVCANPGTAADLAEVQAVYKPRRGERPLWDFPQGTLHQREQAAFLISEALGWGLVPPTVVRDGPHGVGSLQFFVEHDPDRHYFTFEGDSDYRRQLQQIVLLDIVINNADRKSGHVLLAGSAEAAPGQLWAIDHGICFHSDYKLRTVIWEFAGMPIPADLLADLKNLQEKLRTNAQVLSTCLQELLNKGEMAALQKRVGQLINKGKFPEPGPGRHYPWPPV